MTKCSKLIGPYEVSIDITNRCNLRCLHCYNYSGDNACIDSELNDEELINLIHEIIKIKPINVCLAGGEPLLRKDIAYRIIGLLSKNNIITSMVSNGLLLDEETVDELKKAGLNRIQISLDGLEESHDKLRNKKGVFKGAMKSLDILNAKGISTYLGFVPTKWGINDFDEVFNIAVEKNIKCIRTQYIMPNGRGMLNFNRIKPSESDYRVFVNKINMLKRKIAKENLSLTIEWDDPVQHFIDISEFKSIYPQIHIKTNGYVTLTPYLPISFGNIRNDSLTQLIKNNLLDAGSNKDFVSICSKIRCVEDLSLCGLDLPDNFMEQDIIIKI